MRVLIEARQSAGGIERYTQTLIGHLRRNLGDDIVTFGHSCATSPGDRRRRGRLHAMLGDFRRVLTDQYALPAEARRQQVDLFHSLNYFVPRRLPVPCVVTCHDLWLLDHVGEKKDGWIRRYERCEELHGLRRANRIIAVSESVATDIEQRFGQDRDRVSVIYPPIPDLPDPGEWPDSLPPPDRPFFLTVCTLEPRKNLERMLEGHEPVFRETGIPLYLVGAYGWRQQRVLRRIDRSGGAACWLGAVSDAELAALYRRASAVVAFSRDEGFDYPSVEALTFGTPVVASDIPVHREVIGDLGLYAMPDEPDGLARRLLEAAALGEDQRRDFRVSAHERVALLRHRGRAELYRRVYREALGT